MAAVPGDAAFPANSRPIRRGLHSCLGLAVALLAGLPGAHAGGAAADFGRAVELPTYVVSEWAIAPKPEHWRHAALPGLEILSACSDRETRDLLDDLQRFRQALALTWTGAQPVFAPSQISPSSSGAPDPNVALPIAVILCPSARFDRFLPAAATRGSGGAGIASLFLQEREQSAIIIDGDAKTVNVVSPRTQSRVALGMAINQAFAGGNKLPLALLGLETHAEPSGMAIDQHRLLRREYVRFVQNCHRQHPPAWLEEGLAQLLSALKFDRSTATLAALDDPEGGLPIYTYKEWVDFIRVLQGMEHGEGGIAVGSPPGPAELNQRYQELARVYASPDSVQEGTFNTELQHRVLMPMDKFFAVERNSPEALHPVGSLWAKQAEAFVHLCLYGRGQRYQTAFVHWVSRLNTELPSEAVFKECFRMTYAQMGSELSDYVNHTDYRTIKRSLKNGSFAESPPVQLRDATEAEAGRITSDALRMAGNAEAARLALIVPYLRGAREPELLAALGLAEVANQKPDRARRLLEAAATQRIYCPRAHLELARLRLAEASAEAGPDGKLDLRQTVAVLEPLFVAREQPPALAEVYDLIAEVWQRSAGRPAKDNLEVLVEGVRIFPEDAGLLISAVKLFSAAGLHDDAAALVDLGLKRDIPGPAGEELRRIRLDPGRINPLR